MKTIVCNNCLGARIYNLLNRQYDNPFMWCLIPPSQYFSLVKNFDSIDFNDVVPRIQQDSPMNQNTNVVTLRLGGIVDVPYVHHHESEQYREITTIGVDKYYWKMREYVKDKFNERIKRMSNDIVFLFEESSSFYEQFKLIDTRHGKIFVTNDTSIKNEDNFFVIYDSRLPPSGEKAKRILEYAPELFQ